jgi:hypothetical protein
MRVCHCAEIRKQLGVLVNIFFKLNSKNGTFSRTAFHCNISSHRFYLVFDQKQPNAMGIFIAMKCFIYTKNLLAMKVKVYT